MSQIEKCRSAYLALESVGPVGVSDKEPDCGPAIVAPAREDFRRERNLAKPSGVVAAALDHVIGSRLERNIHVVREVPLGTAAKGDPAIDGICCVQ